MKKLLAATILSASIGAGAGMALVAGDAKAEDTPTAGTATEDGSGRRCNRLREGRRHRIVKAMITTTAEAIGITPEELRAELRDGGSIADAATAHGVDPADVEAALLAEVTEHVNDATENGRIDEARAAEILDNAPDRIHEFVTKAREPRPA